MKYYKPNSLTWWTGVLQIAVGMALAVSANVGALEPLRGALTDLTGGVDRKSTRLNSSHQIISYADFCLKKKNK